MIIHFICRGNTYRSRLAEACLNARGGGVRAISSGIFAEQEAIFPIRWYTERLMEKHDLGKFMSPCWQQTTKELVKQSDHIVFFSKQYFDCCKDLIGPGQKYEIWDISDVDPNDADENLIKQTSSSFYEIEKRVDDLWSTYHQS